MFAAWELQGIDYVEIDQMPDELPDQMSLRMERFFELHPELVYVPLGVYLHQIQDFVGFPVRQAYVRSVVMPFRRRRNKEAIKSFHHPTSGLPEHEPPLPHDDHRSTNENGVVTYVQNLSPDMDLY